MFFSLFLSSIQDVPLVLLSSSAFLPQSPPTLQVEFELMNFFPTYLVEITIVR